jgi:hypothetical protein
MGNTMKAAMHNAMAGLTFAPASSPASSSASRRRYHVCLSPEALDKDPELLDVVAKVGVTEVWIAGFFYGFWPHPIETVRHWRRQAEQRGLTASVVNVPLGHPGDSLGSSDSGFPLTPPKRWRAAVKPDGSTYVGTSLHAPATEENAAALARLRADGVRRVFLDDDFRLAVGPGVIGGCFCGEHRQAFLDRGGYADARWAELLDDVRNRNLSPILRDWVEFTCDQLTASFRAQEKALGPRGRLGIMVMYLGAEKAGIRLADYSGVPLRVGELMFDDGSFGAVKGKTDELFSVLFHRRFVRPDLAYSETTAYPSDRLSAANMAAKLAISTIADVRHTMFMSGLTPFPKSHWDTLAPAMKENARIHERVAGHRPRGPLKLCWGEASRYVGDDVPFSMPLALGIPFEVTAKPAASGWTFLSDHDAQDAASGRLRSAGTRFIGRSDGHGVRGIPETPAELAAWKRSILPDLGRTPHLVDDGHAVLAWYPTARAAIVWNLEDRRRECVLAVGSGRRMIPVGPLGIALVEDIVVATQYVGPRAP